MSNILKKAMGEELYEIYQLYSKAPFDIVSFVKNHLDINLYQTADLPADVSGCIFERDGSIKIYVQSSDVLQRKRFTIAHELGHYFLHRDRINEGFVDGIGNATGRNGYGKEEREANKFAAELLMPEGIFKERCLKHGGNIQRIALDFNVSEAAASVRMKKLGISVDDELSYFF